MIQLFVIAGGFLDPCWYLFSISYQYFLDCWLCVVIFVKFLLVHIGRCSLLFFTSDCDRHSFLWGILRLPLFSLLIFFLLKYFFYNFVILDQMKNCFWFHWEFHFNCWHFMKQIWICCYLYLSILSWPQKKVQIT